MTQEKFAIRFGLGAIKAVGFGVMELAVKEREEHGKFLDLYNFCERIDPRSINKKSVEALAKAGAFDSLHKNRCQIAESFDVLSTYSAQKKEEASSSQMSLFGGFAQENAKPELKKVLDWNKPNRLQKEFEAFGFFLNEHPLDDYLDKLKKRGAIFSSKFERDELEDNSIVKIAGVIAASKHRSSARGRFAYLTISDPFGIFEAMIFDEALITSARDILVDGSVVMFECLIRKDEGGLRILVKDVKKLDDFVQNTQASEKDFEDIKKQPTRQFQRNRDFGGESFLEKKQQNQPVKQAAPQQILVEKKVFSKVEITIKSRDPITNIKNILQPLVSSDLGEKSTLVLLAIDQTKIELGQKFILGEAEILKIKHIFGVLKVSVE